MDPLTLLILGGLISGGAQIYKGYSAGKDADKQLAFQEKQQRKKELADRRAAIARALGAGKETGFLNYGRKQPNMPGQSNTSFADTMGTLGGIASSYGSMNYGKGE